MKRLNRLDLDLLLESVAGSYRLLTPQKLKDGSRLLRPWMEGELDLTGEPVRRKPTEYFLPQLDPLLTISSEGNVHTSTAEEKPLCLFGLNRADLQCLGFVDRFCAVPPQDDAYFKQRQNALLIGLTGDCGADRQLSPVAGTNCDIELIAVEEGWLAQAYTEQGVSFLSEFADAEPGAQDAIEQLSKRRIDEERATIEKAARIVQQDLVPDSFWQEIGARCILCSGCNLVCPTCTCFCVQDRTGATGTERSRVWDSCQYDGFMREASGHNPLGTEAIRTRRRIHHKLAADFERWGELSCFLCGRCDKVCPTGIGIQSVAAEIVERFKEQMP